MGKNRHEQNRKRYRTIAFRCSDLERHELEKRVELSGLQKQDYFLKSVFHQGITVIGNELLFQRMRNTLEEILAELKRVEGIDSLDLHTVTPVRTTVELLEGFAETA